MSGLKHRERRSYLRGEMGTLVQLFNQLPGLLAPKFPMVMTSLVMAKTEVRVSESRKQSFPDSLWHNEC